MQRCQNATDPSSKRGQEIIRHAALGIDIHLFVREKKLAAGKAAPFTYHGRLLFESHQGSQPMNVIFQLNTAVASFRSIQSKRYCAANFRKPWTSGSSPVSECKISPTAGAVCAASRASKNSNRDRRANTSSTLSAYS